MTARDRAYDVLANHAIHRGMGWRHVHVNWATLGMMPLWHR